MVADDSMTALMATAVRHVKRQKTVEEVKKKVSITITTNDSKASSDRKHQILLITKRRKEHGKHLCKAGELRSKKGYPIHDLLTTPKTKKHQILSTTPYLSTCYPIHNRRFQTNIKFCQLHPNTGANGCHHWRLSSFQIMKTCQRR